MSEEHRQLKAAFESELERYQSVMEQVKGVADKGGFDVVIANPPYIRQERFSEQKSLLKATFPDVYHGVADL